MTLKYDIRIQRKEIGCIEWSIKFADNTSDTDQQLTIDVAKNFFDVLQKLDLERKNNTPDKEYSCLTAFQKDILLQGKTLCGILYA